MAKLSDDSQLYNQLANIYEKHKDHITLDVFNQCVDIALKANYREIKYILFKLKCLYDDDNVGMDKIDLIKKFTKLFAGDSYRCSFIISVLETALEEK